MRRMLAPSAGRRANPHSFPGSATRIRFSAPLAEPVRNRFDPPQRADNSMAKKHVPSGRRPESKPDAPWRNLAGRFAALVAGPPESWPPWLEIWNTLAEDEWLRKELRQQALAALRRFELPRDLRGDVEHDALLVLARRLRRSPDLRADRTRIEEGFGAWMGTILRHACRKVARLEARRQRQQSELRLYTLLADPHDVLESRMDLSVAMRRIDEPTRSVLSFYQQQYSLREIAESLSMPYARVQRELRKGLRQLRRMLG